MELTVPPTPDKHIHLFYSQTDIIVITSSVVMTSAALCFKIYYRYSTDHLLACLYNTVYIAFYTPQSLFPTAQNKFFWVFLPLNIYTSQCWSSFCLLCCFQNNTLKEVIFKMHNLYFSNFLRNIFHIPLYPIVYSLTKKGTLFILSFFHVTAENSVIW